MPEDDANRQLAHGFELHDRVKDARIQVLPPAKGWLRVLQSFVDDYVPHLRKFVGGHMILLIDFDGQGDERKKRFDEEIPDDLKARVFVVGSKYDPETLKKALNVPLEEIGTSLADDCGAGTNGSWDHDQLRHNAAEMDRLVQIVKPFLF